MVDRNTKTFTLENLKILILKETQTDHFLFYPVLLILIIEYLKERQDRDSSCHFLCHDCNEFHCDIKKCKTSFCNRLLFLHCKMNKCLQCNQFLSMCSSHQTCFHRRCFLCSILCPNCGHSGCSQCFILCNICWKRSCSSCIRKCMECNQRFCAQCFHSSYKGYSQICRICLTREFLYGNQIRENISK